MNRKVFFDFVRNLPFGGKISADQFDGLDRILKYREARYPHWENRWLAYLLATVFHETARRMQPIEEMGGQSYLRSKKYYPWYGRGLIQITWEENYKKYGITDPKQALEWNTALRVAFDGMEKGKFSRDKSGPQTLARYFNSTKNDPEGARRIINGVDKKSLIAGYYKNFLDALEQAEKAVEAPQEVRAPAPKADVPDAAPKPSEDPMTQTVTAIAGTGIVTSIVSAVSNLWALLAVVVIVVGVGIYLWQRKKLSNVAGV